MPDIKAKLKTFINPFLSHPTCLTNAILLVVTAGFEQAWEDVNFKCPEKRKGLYSVVFLLAPAVVLCILGILARNMAWRLCQGCKSNDKHDCSLYNCCTVFLRALVVPVTWVFVALMDGDFYACYEYLPSCQEGLSGPASTSSPIAGVDPATFGLADGYNCTRNTTAWKYEKKAESQLIAWLVLVICLLFGTCVVFCGSCYSRRPYYPHLYSKKLKKGERKLMEEGLMKQAEEDGKRNVGALIMEFASNKTSLSVSDWQSICRERTEQECEPITNDTKKQVPFHSPLSEFLGKRSSILTNFDAKAAPEPKQDE